jgi:miniconductance mechanosensitive channel
LYPQGKDKTMPTLAELPLYDHVLSIITWLQNYRLAYAGSLCALLLLMAWVANLALKGVLVRGISHVLHLTVFDSNSQGLPHRVISQLSNVVPAWIISTGVAFIPGLPKAAVKVTDNVCSAFIILSFALFFSGLLDMANALYQKRPSAKVRSVKGYIQIIRILLAILTLILCVATLVDRSPLILLSGLGALAAVLLLIFQGTILSTVAAVQINAGGIVKLGDWIQMDHLNANGEVIDIALHSITIRNFDYTLTTLPSQKIITDAMINHRGMRNSNSRRIKRAFFIDQSTVHFMNDEEKSNLSRFGLLRDYLKTKEDEIQLWNQNLPAESRELVNARRITNMGSFRAYLELYLRNHPGIHQDRPLMCRHMDPTPNGLPVEIYAFTNTTVWSEYENIQSDIFDHILAIMPEFGLGVHQQPTGRDLSGLASR